MSAGMQRAQPFQNKIFNWFIISSRSLLTGTSVDGWFACSFHALCLYLFLCLCVCMSVVLVRVWLLVYRRGLWPSIPYYSICINMWS